MRPRTDRHTDGQTDTQTRMTTIHFSWSTTHAKCNKITTYLNKPERPAFPPRQLSYCRLACGRRTTMSLCRSPGKHKGRNSSSNRSLSQTRARRPPQYIRIIDAHSVQCNALYRTIVSMRRIQHQTAITRFSAGVLIMSVIATALGVPCTLLNCNSSTSENKGTYL